MANVRAPNIDFTLGTPGNRIHMAGTVATTQLYLPVLPPQEGDTFVPSPNLENWGSSGGGGGGPVTYSTAITG